MRALLVYVVLPCSLLTAEGPSVHTGAIRIDQFGYRPGDAKIAVVAQPVVGYNAGSLQAPGTSFEVRRWNDHSVVLTLTPAAWNGGATESASGDIGWWVDFSAVVTPGEYYLWDVQRGNGSDRIRIGSGVYREVLRTACRMLFYNRCNAAKPAPLAGVWSDAASHNGAGQDGAARLVTAQGDAGTARDLRGAWLDAGDYNKYPTFLSSTLHSLFAAYQRDPALWRSLELGIPESGDAVPDLLDEARRGLDWLLKLQVGNDGGVLQKVGCIDYNEPAPPSSDTRPRYYLPPATSSTIVAAGLLAHGAVAATGSGIPAADIAAWRTGAIAAWTWYQARSASLQTNGDDGTIKAGDADMSEADQRSEAVTAAVWLFALTGEAVYCDHVRDHLADAGAYNDWWWGTWHSPSGEALMAYAAMSGADPATAAAIRTRRSERANGDFYRYAANDSLYRAPLPEVTWGSNQMVCNIGQTVMELVDAGLDGTRTAVHREHALGMLHYVHGVNPLAMTYLSNMGTLGAARSATRIYHSWFKTLADPPPGYLVGGANKYYDGTMTVRGTSALVSAQPDLKHYTDDHTGDRVWEMSEPGIYYQAAYIQLLSRFVSVPLPGDANQDDRVDAADLVLVNQAFGRRLGGTGWLPAADLNADGQVDAEDVAIVTRALTP